MKVVKLIIFYFLSFTWGLPMSLVGLLVSIALLVSGHAPKLFNNIIYFEVGTNWGGVNFGPVFVCCKNSSDDVKKHECGHSLQNILFGPFMPFIVSIPSFVRYWLREQRTIEEKIKFSYYTSLITSGAQFCLLFVLVLLNLYRWIFLPIVLLVYAGCILIWLLEIEIPKYKTTSPLYDEIWFESQATTLGNKYF